MSELISRYLGSGFFVSFLAAGLVYGVCFMLIYLVRQVQRQRQKTDEFRAELSEIRSLLEGRVYEATGKLMKLPSRWKDINHLLLSASTLDFDSPGESVAKLSPLYITNGIKGKEVQVDERLVFVIMPFHSSFKEYFRTVRNVCEEAGFKCIRGDEEYKTSEVFRDILVHIARARLVIANIDGRNPNVFYELGIAHAVGKQVLMTTKDIANSPFDVRSKRILVYRDSRQLSKALKLQLEALNEATGKST